ncbi:MAG TPA: DUF3443 family protein, partial [Steroidobacteraceae bacterium]|nr:DUF3443 family protein [Steroidobacteraceae bacterium]
MAPMKLLVCAAALALLAGCGGGSSTIKTGGGPPPMGSNVVAVTVDGGPAGLTVPTTDVLFTTVTVCAHGSTTNCQTIDHVQVDTGSVGLRILASALGSLKLTPVNGGTGTTPLAECYVFADGFIWGPVETADVQIGGESASNIEVQVVGDPNYPESGVPSDCSSQGGGMSFDTLDTLAANGIIGLGTLAQDCGPGCTSGTQTGWYYS